MLIFSLFCFNLNSFSIVVCSSCHYIDLTVFLINWKNLLNFICLRWLHCITFLVFRADCVECLPTERLHLLVHGWSVGQYWPLGWTWLVPLTLTLAGGASLLPGTASHCIDLAWHGLEASARQGQGRPGLVWRLVTATAEVEVYQEVITTLQYTHWHTRRYTSSHTSHPDSWNKLSS